MRLFKGKLKSISGFVLMSDGTEQSLYDRRKKRIAPAVTRLMQRVCLTPPDIFQTGLESTLKNVLTLKTLDDCSLALLVNPLCLIREVDRLSFSERRKLFGVGALGRSARRRVRKYEILVKVLAAPSGLGRVARALRLKPRYAGKVLSRFEKNGCIVREGSLYRIR